MSHDHEDLRMGWPAVLEWLHEHLGERVYVELGPGHGCRHGGVHPDGPTVAVSRVFLSAVDSPPEADGAFCVVRLGEQQDTDNEAGILFVEEDRLKGAGADDDSAAWVARGTVTCVWCEDAYDKRSAEALGEVEPDG